MEQLYPPGPVSVDDDLAAPSQTYRSRARVALFSLLLFIALYLSLTGWFGWTAYKYFVDAMGADGSAAFIGFALATTAAFLTVFLVKGLFFVSHGGEVSDIEVSAEEQPQLFEFLNRLADEAGAPRPYRVFLSGRVNAAVFYDLTLLNLLFPSKKNLEIGLALVNGLTLGELKAVLAHEFGHFRQGSMAVGRWVYVAQQVATHIIQERDILDRFLLGVSRFDIRIAWVGWILRLIVWSLRAILDTAFSLVVLAQRSLSREMEFHADLVSVSLTGSDALVHALHRLHAADDAWERALTIAGQELGQGRAVTDVFVIQKIITQRMKDILDDEYYDVPPPLPASNPQQHRVFDTEMAHPPRMWSTHPPNRAREDNAKSRYIVAPVDQRPAWDLFDDAQNLREQMTAHILSGSPGADELPKAALTETVASVKKQFGKVIYDRRYRGTYMGRSAVREFAAVAELFASDIDTPNLSACFDSLYPAGLSERLERWRNLEEERAALQALYDGNLTPPDGVIRHRGVILKRRQLPAAIEKTGAECDAARLDLCKHDQRVRGVHRAAATGLGDGWSAYHTGIVSLLHYADHSEANLSDARGRLQNLWAVVIADGKVSSGEIKQLLAVARDLFAVMQSIDKQKGQVQLCKHVAAEMGIGSWQEILNEEFTLTEPSRENIGEWLGVLDDWVNYFLHALSRLQQESLESLLAVESGIEQKYRNGETATAAPAAASVPSEYATLLPNTERKRQTRLGLWDRFQTADGFVPGLARFMVAAVIVGGLLGAGMYTGSSASVIVYNGLAAQVQVTMDGDSRVVAPLSTATLSPDAVSDLHINTHSADGSLVESIVVDASNSFADYVYNVAGAAPLVEWTAVYGSTGERPPDYLGTPQWLSSRADYIFTDPPEQIKTSNDGGTREVLEGFGYVDPQYLSDYLPEDAATADLIRAHAKWDHPNSEYVLTWLALAATEEDFAGVLAHRLQRNENEVLALRFQQDVTDGDEAAARVCSRHTERARQSPESVDWQYLAMRCIGDEAARGDAFVAAYQQYPEHPWIAGAAGYTHAERAEWDAAQVALDRAYSGLPGMRSSYVAEVARVRRMKYGVEDADLRDLGQKSPWLETLLTIEELNGVEDLSLQGYVQLASGQLEQAVSQAGVYADEILRLAAASDGATDEIIRNARALDSESGIDTNTIGIALGFAKRTGQPTADLLRQLDSTLDTEARFIAAFFALLDDRTIDAAKLEQALSGANPATRGHAYAMGVVALGDRAPASWREGAKRLLFVAERPYFR